jgi:hypothetical protein
MHVGINLFARRIWAWSCALLCREKVQIARQRGRLKNMEGPLHFVANRGDAI